MSHSVEEWKEFANPEIRKNVYAPYGYKNVAPDPKIILVNKSLGSLRLASRIYGLILSILISHSETTGEAEDSTSWTASGEIAIGNPGLPAAALCTILTV